MVTKINRITGLGLVFSDFTWKPDVPSFKPVNLVYGWNGCGKTTLTRLFDELAAATLEDVAYEIEDDDGAKFGPGGGFATPIRVFNQDYVQKNVRIFESSANTISLVLGEANRELIAQIEADERTLNGSPDDPADVGKIKELQDLRQKKRRKETENEASFTNVARTIGAAIATTGAASRTYRSPNAKSDFAELAEKALLTDEELAAHVLALKQDVQLELDPLAHPTMGDPIPYDALDAAAECLERAAVLCASTVETEVIQRLADYPGISEWVETGLKLHSEAGATECEFCGNDIPADRLGQLLRHFNDADRRLKTEIEDVLSTLRNVLQSIRTYHIPDSARLYTELREPYRAALGAITAARQMLEIQITELGVALQSKKGKTTEVVALDVQLDLASLRDAIDAANAQIGLHNAKTLAFAAVQDQSVAAIKAHHLSTIFDEVKATAETIAKLEEELPQRQTEIADLQRGIAAARAEISSAHAACEQINAGVKTFLGRDELCFEPRVEMVADLTGVEVDTTVGYSIMRGDKPATYMSEGEKTALAFVYFVVHLADGQFPKADGIVVIDDPISSLDSNSLYQAFSFLKNAVTGCGQVFVLTHNFEFLKLLLNWRKGGRAGPTGFYMIKNHVRDNERHASIEAMDRELHQYESEYHYLFKRLKEMQAEQDGSIMRAYPVPNIARKVWDTFLMFQVPSGENPYRKMNELKEAGHDPQKLDAIYKFTNDQSHITGAGFDPALVPETQKVLGELFDMMKDIAPNHYAILDRSTPI